MTRAKFQRIVRKSHRYMGVILGIQFFLWTVGGLYFSWTNIEEIRGENLRREESLIAPAKLTACLPEIIQSLGIDSIVDLNVASILGVAHYQIKVLKQSKESIVLVNTLTGEIRHAVTEQEAVQIAQHSFIQPARAKEVTYITDTNGHHEYRGKPLPAYAVVLDHPSNTTVYVSADLGTVQSFRNNQWRIFDFLWMMHVMDFENRDDINNWLLQVFSLVGLVTICSGFVLFVVSSKRSVPAKQ